MTNVKINPDQLEICKLRQIANRSCRDCKYDLTCDPTFRKIMTYEIPEAKEKEREVKKNGY